MVMTTKKNYRAGFVALLGEPNAGKSTLLNAILGEKVSIVSDKPQTTRARVTGILNLEEAQVIFVDAPGTLKSKSGINSFLQDEVGDVVNKADVLCVLLASDTREETAMELFALAKRSRKPWVAVAPLFDEELYTTQTLRQMAAEFVREACFDSLRQEIPYGLAVRVAEFKEEGNVVRIRCEIIVDKDNHKGIVIGAKGQMLKNVGTAARKEIERVVGRQVFLELHVAVKENWTQNPRMLKELGYVVTKQ
jgi:GTP-binding protein Era